MCEPWADEKEQTMVQGGGTSKNRVKDSSHFLPRSANTGTHVQFLAEKREGQGKNF